MVLVVDTGQKKKRTKVGATIVTGLLIGKVKKEQKWIKLQLYKKQYLMVGGCYDERMLLDEEEKRLEKFLFSFSFFTVASHSCDIKPSHCSELVLLRIC